jgi:choline dehydrogenase
VLPYFRKLETDLDFHDDFHGADGPIIVRRHKLDSLLTEQLAFYKACLDAGFPPSPDHNHPDATGVGPYPLNNPDGIRWSTAIGYLDPARHRLNLTVRPNCLAHRILFDGNRAVGVEVESGGELFSVYGDEVIVSAGAIGSPQLLMLSGVGPASRLRTLDIPIVRDLPGVGRNLRDHPTLDVTWRAKEGFPMPPGDVGPQKVTLRYTAPESRLRNDMITVMRFWPPQRMLKMSVAIYLAAGAGWLELQSRDPHAQPFLNCNFLEDPFDRQRMRDGVHLCLKLTEHRAFKEIVEARNEPLEADLESDDALDSWMLRNVTTMGHVSCTCKMGPASDPMAVVDQHGRVHGIEGLRVADASIMPDCVRANTNATTIMIGERIADFMKQGV